MILYTNNKNKIDLQDFLYKEDIYRRRCVAEFTPFERDLFYELVLGSIETSIENLADDLDVDTSIVSTTLAKHVNTGLYVIESHKVIVNKEERKLFEIELEKFNSSFHPNMNYLKALLNKVPIDLLPKWYALPKTCEAIFSSIVDKHFISPKHYERYLDELEFDDPIINKIIKDIYSTPNYYLTLSELKSNYYLSEDVLYQIVAILELNLVAFHSYEKIGDVLVEVLTPPHEYRLLLLDKYLRRPKRIEEDEVTIAAYTIHKDYIPKVTKTLKKIHELSSGNKNTDVEFEDLKIIKRLLEIDLLDTMDERLFLSPNGESFLTLPEQERPRYFLRCPKKDNKRFFSEWIQRQIEKEIINYHDWVYVDDFVDSLHIPLDGHPPLELIRKGRSTFYTVPIYTDSEKESIKTLICDYYAIGGVVELGEVNNRIAFRLTSYGKTYLQ